MAKSRNIAKILDLTLLGPFKFVSNNMGVERMRRTPNNLTLNRLPGFLPSIVVLHNASESSTVNMIVVLTNG